jgi:hypothetical protein
LEGTVFLFPISHRTGGANFFGMEECSEGVLSTGTTLVRRLCAFCGTLLAGLVVMNESRKMQRRAGHYSTVMYIVAFP